MSARPEGTGLMAQKPVTLIVSDLHMGDGGRGDDFVDDNNQFATFVRQQAQTDRGRRGEIELIINGDFLEFVQVLPERYTLNSPDYWCSEEESLDKLDCILAGHPEVFKALTEFQAPGNIVTIFPGNHDIDLHWTAVQDRLRSVAGNVNIELGEHTYTRYGGKLHISHGHLFPSIDPVNGFKNWRHPILRLPDDNAPPRLEMCTGTLFVVRFVNPLEEKYPFVDNVHPQTELVRILLREDRWGLRTVGWLGARFILQHFGASLSAGSRDDIGPELLGAIQGDPFFREKIAELCRDLLGRPDMTEASVSKQFGSEEQLAELLEMLLKADGSLTRWTDIIEIAKPAVNAAGGGSGSTLSLHDASRIDVRAECLTIARNIWKVHADIVVLGHTHLHQEIEENGCRYYNPGSWTRYIEEPSDLTLADLEDDNSYPYELNYVQIEDDGGTIRSKLVCFDRQTTSAAGAA
jgi:UDP-2,3-diacylglucosamine pyrophosphatase LpxH